MFQITDKKKMDMNAQVKNKYLHSVWLGGLVKNFALIQLVEAQKNLDEMQKIAKAKEEKKERERK